MTHCFIGLGSNLEQPLQQVSRAVDELARIAGCQLLGHSPWYRSKAVGPGDQPDYINGVAALDCQLAPIALLDQLQAIENTHLRRRVEHWGPRTLDLDLLLYGEQQIAQPRLTVPHPLMLERNFVLYPLHDLAPELQLPDGTLLASLLDYCPKGELQIITSNP